MSVVQTILSPLVVTELGILMSMGKICPMASDDKQLSESLKSEVDSTLLIASQARGNDGAMEEAIQVAMNSNKWIIPHNTLTIVAHVPVAHGFSK